MACGADEVPASACSFPPRALHAAGANLFAGCRLSPYPRGMATKPTNTAILYALTSSGACSVTLSQNGKSHTWQVLPEGGGQATFIVPPGAVVEISDDCALLSPLPFKVAPGAGGVGGPETDTTRNSLPFMAAESNAAFSSLSWAGLCAAAGSEWFSNAMQHCVCGDTAYIDLSSTTGTVSDTPAYETMSPPLLRGKDGRFLLGEGVPNLRRFILKMERGWYGSRMRYACRNENVDFVLIFKVLGAHSFPHMEEAASNIRAKSLTLIFPSASNESNTSKIGSIVAYATHFNEEKLACPIRFIMPALVAGADYKLGLYHSGTLHYDTQITHLDISACMSSYVSSFSFYLSNLNSVENLIYLMDNLGTPAAGNLPQLSFGVAAELVDMSGDEPLYSDAALQAAVLRLREKGWEDVPSLITIS